MDIGSIILSLGFTVVCAVFIANPLLKKRGKDVLVLRTARSEREQQRSALLAERDRVLTALEEMEADHALGKIAEEDYPEMRVALMQEGAEALRQLDELNGKPVTLEATPAVAAPVEDDLETLIQARKAQRQEKKAEKFCFNCGEPLSKGDRFCPSCGSKQ